MKLLIVLPAILVLTAVCYFQYHMAYLQGVEHGLQAGYADAGAQPYGDEVVTVADCTAAVKAISSHYEELESAKVGTISEFQALIRCDEASKEFVIPFSEEPTCNCRGEYGPDGQEKCTLGQDLTHVWVNTGCEDANGENLGPKVEHEIYCLGLRGTDI